MFGYIKTSQMESKSFNKYILLSIMTLLTVPNLKAH